MVAIFSSPCYTPLRTMNEYEHLMQKRASQYIAPIAGGLIGAGLGYMLPSDDEEYEYDKYGRRVKKTKPNNLLKAVNVLGGGLMGAGLGMGAHQLWHSLPGTGWKQKMDGVYNKLTGAKQTPQGGSAKKKAPAAAQPPETRTNADVMPELPLNSPTLDMRDTFVPEGSLAEDDPLRYGATTVTPSMNAARDTKEYNQAVKELQDAYHLAQTREKLMENIDNATSILNRRAPYPGAPLMLPEQAAEQAQKEESMKAMSALGVGETAPARRVNVGGDSGPLMTAAGDKFSPELVQSYLSDDFARRVAPYVAGGNKKAAYLAIARSIAELYGVKPSDPAYRQIAETVSKAMKENESNW